jgi:putative flavoprotein involved in K+ transport
VLLERGEVGETWRSQRWDSFVLNTPNWGQRLPGFAYAGDEPDAFAPLTEVISYLEDYADTIAAPVRAQTPVTAVRGKNGGYVVETRAGTLEAANVVIAAGAFGRPFVPAVAAGADASITQLHASEYRSPEQLPPGGVLIVGSGQSGCQIADDLRVAGRAVTLAVGRCPRLPRRVLGQDVLHWLVELGLADQTVDTLPSPAARAACNPAVSGNDGGHDCNPRGLARRGTALVGRVTAIEGTHVSLGDELEGTLAAGDAFVAELRRQVLAHAGVAEDTEPVDADPPAPVEPRRELDLEAAGIGTIIWATGYRPDLGWIDLPLADAAGWPQQERGVTPFPGLYFVGLNWLHTRKSALFLGVGEDAGHVARHLDENRPRQG